MKFISVRLDKVIGIVKTLIYGESGYAADVNSSNELKVSATVVAPVPIPTGAATAANQVLQLAQETTAATKLTSIAAEDFATQTTLAAMNAKLVSGTDIGDVTINNAAGAGAYVRPGTATSWDGLQLNELVPVAYDNIACTNGAYGPTEVLFKVGAATVATLVIVYDGSTGFISTVTRS